MNCAFVEFLAEEEPVYVVPNFRGDSLDFITGSIGPFIPNSPIKVPLWLAINLRKQHKCRIQCPEWLTVESLKVLKRLERTSGNSVLQNVPNHYMEIAFQILQHASEDVQKGQQVRSLLEDIENLRQHKITEGLHKMADEEAAEALHFLKLNNASAMEINAIRPILLVTLEKFHKLYADGTRAVLDSTSLQTPVAAAPPFNASTHRTTAPQYSQETVDTFDTQDLFVDETADNDEHNVKRLRRNRD